MTETTVEKSAEPLTPETLVAVLLAVHKAGYRRLERQLRQRLLDEHGITVRFHTSNLTQCSLSAPTAASRLRLRRSRS